MHLIAIIEILAQDLISEAARYGGLIRWTLTP